MTKSTSSLKEAVSFQMYHGYLSALINSDVSGLSDDEEEMLSSFEQQVIEIHGAGFWAIPDSEEETFFGMDEVSKLRGDVISVDYIPYATY